MTVLQRPIVSRVYRLEDRRPGDPKHAVNIAGIHSRAEGFVQIVLLTERADAHRKLLRGLEAAGHTMRVQHAYTAIDDTSGATLPAAVLVDGATMPAGLDAVTLAAAGLCVIALVPPEAVGVIRPSESWVDFAVLPASAEEVVARINLHHVRTRGQADEVVRSGELAIDVANYSVSVSGDQIELTYKEYELLRFMVTHPGRVYTRESLLEHVWGYDYWGGSRTIDVHIRRIRSKLPSQVSARIETVHQVGYRYAAPR